MTEERKQELEQLLGEAMESLVIRYGYGGPLSIPVDVYRKYLQERWAYYGIDFLSFAFSVHFTPDIADKPTKSNLLDYIREELALFIDEDATLDFVRDSIQTDSYLIESDSTCRYRLYNYGIQSLPLFMVLERLLEITLVRGTEEAVSAFDRCSCPEGTHVFFRDFALLERIKLEAEFQVFEGVRLVPLPSSEISQEIARYLPGFPVHAFIDQAGSFFGKTLLVIDRPGFTIFRRHSERAIQGGTRIDDLPFQVEVHDVKFPHSDAVHSFQDLFCHALSLVCNSAVQIVIRGWLLEEDKSFKPHHGSGGMLRYVNPFRSSPEAEEADIEKAKCRYDILTNLDSKTLKKLQIPIDRWIKSKTDGNRVDKIIDLGIAFEALYVPDGGTEITFKLSVRAAWHLGTDKEHRDELLKKFKQIYSGRSKAVHNGKLDQTVKFGEEHIPISEFIQRAQDLCRESILKILEAGEFPDWNDLILG